MYMKNHPIFTFSFILALLFNSCGTLHSLKINSEFQPHDESTKLYIKTFGNDFEYIGTGKTPYVLFGRSNGYLIKQEKNGFKSSTYPVTERKYNTPKILDVIVPSLAVIILASTDFEEETPFAPTFFIGTLGWCGLMGSGWRVYDKHYDLPKLYKLPEKITDVKYLFVQDVSLDIIKGKYRNLYYEKYKDYVKDHLLYSSSFTNDISNNSNVFPLQLNKILGKYGYVDTTESLVPQELNTNKIRCKITSIERIFVQNLSYVDLTATISIFSKYSNQLLDSMTLSSKSSWELNVSSTKDRNQLMNQIVDALENNVIEFLNSESLKKVLKIDNEQIAIELNSWENIIFQNNNTVNNIEEASNATVTLKTKNGHGSGIVVSADGYIITNHHVTVDNPNDISVLFLNGDTLKATLIRFNPFYDLALIKVESKGLKHFNLPLQSNFSLGEDVFAIGTPAGLELGQTISKGIISAKRKIDEYEYIQTDVGINRGNSGGALISKNAELIGIVNAKVFGLGVESIGFAIPATYISKALKVN